MIAVESRDSRPSAEAEDINTYRCHDDVNDKSSALSQGHPLTVMEELKVPQTTQNKHNIDSGKD